MSELPFDATVQPGGAEAGAGGHPAAPGAWLAAARREHGLTVEQVASQLNLAPRQVMALEADDYAALPGMVIVRGFLRAYAKLLKIDPVPLLAMLGESAPAVGAAPTRPMAASAFSQTRMPALHNRPKRSAKGPLAALVAVAVVAAGASYVLGWWPEGLTRRFGQFRGAVLTSKGGPSAVDAGDAARAADAGSVTGSATGVAAGEAGNVTSGEAGLTSTTTLSNPVASLPSAGASPTSSTVPTDGAGAAAASAAPSPAASAAPAAVSAGSVPAETKGAAGGGDAANALVLRVQQDSWIEIKRADHTVLVSRLFKAGSVETFDIDQPATLIIGNLAGVEATLRGAALPLDRGAKGNVAKLRIK